MASYLQKLPYYIIEAIIVQKCNEHPDALPINDQYLIMLDKRIEAGLSSDIAIAMNMLAPMYGQTYNFKRGGYLADQELQGYLDTLSLYITFWVQDNTEDEDHEAEAFAMDQIPEFTTFPPQLQEAANACMKTNLGLLKTTISSEQKADGISLLHAVSASLREKSKSGLYQQGINTAEQTYLLHVDIVRTFYTQ